MRHFDVQLMAAIALLKERLSNKEPEKENSSAVAPLYLRALKGKGSHLVTVNDYLARLGAG